MIIQVSDRAYANSDDIIAVEEADRIDQWTTTIILRSSDHILSVWSVEEVVVAWKDV
jgi:hypothetical protein